MKFYPNLDSRLNLSAFFNWDTARGRRRRIWKEIRATRDRIERRCDMTQKAYTLDLHQQDRLRQSQYISRVPAVEYNQRNCRMASRSVPLSISGSWDGLIPRALGEVPEPLQENVMSTVRMFSRKMANGLSPDLLRCYKMTLDYIQAVRRMGSVHLCGRGLRERKVIPSFTRHHGQRMLFQAAKCGQGFPKSGVRPEKRRNGAHKDEWVEMFRVLKARLQELAHTETYTRVDPVPRWKLKWRKMDRKRKARQLLRLQRLLCRKNNSPIEEFDTDLPNMDLLQSPERLSLSDILLPHFVSPSQDRFEGDLPRPPNSHRQSEKDKEGFLRKRPPGWSEATELREKENEESSDDESDGRLEFVNEEQIDTNTNSECDHFCVADDFGSKASHTFTKLLPRLLRKCSSRDDDSPVESTHRVDVLHDTEDQETYPKEQSLTVLDMLDQMYERHGDAPQNLLEREDSTDQQVSETGLTKVKHSKAGNTHGKMAAGLNTDDVEADLYVSSLYSPDLHEVLRFTSHSLQTDDTTPSIQTILSETTPKELRLSINPRIDSDTYNNQSLHSIAELPKPGLAPTQNVETDTNQTMYTDFEYRIQRSAISQSWIEPAQQTNIHPFQKLDSNSVQKLEQYDFPEILQTSPVQHSQTSFGKMYPPEGDHNPHIDTEQCFCREKSSGRKNGNLRKNDDNSGQDYPREFDYYQAENDLNEDSSAIKKTDSRCDITDADRFSEGYVTDDELSNLSDSDIVNLVRSANQHACELFMESPCGEQESRGQSKNAPDVARCKKPQTAVLQKAQVLVRHICDNIKTMVSGYFDPNLLETRDNLVGKCRSREVHSKSNENQKTTSRSQKETKNIKRQALTEEKATKTNRTRRKRSTKTASSTARTDDIKQQRNSVQRHEPSETHSVTDQRTDTFLKQQKTENDCPSYGKEKRQERKTVKSNYLASKYHSKVNTRNNPSASCPTKIKLAKSTGTKNPKNGSEKLPESTQIHLQSTKTNNFKETRSSSTRKCVTVSNPSKLKSMNKTKTNSASRVDNYNVCTVNTRTENNVKVAQTPDCNSHKSAKRGKSLHSLLTPSSAHGRFSRKSMPCTRTNLDIVKDLSSKPAGVASTHEHKSTSELMRVRPSSSSFVTKFLQTTFPECRKQCVQKCASSCSTSRLRTSRLSKSTVRSTLVTSPCRVQPAKDIQTSQSGGNGTLRAEAGLTSCRSPALQGRPKKNNSSAPSIGDKRSSSSAQSDLNLSLQSKNLPCDNDSPTLEVTRKPIVIPNSDVQKFTKTGPESPRQTLWATPSTECLTQAQPVNLSNKDASALNEVIPPASHSKNNCSNVSIYAHHTQSASSTQLNDVIMMSCNILLAAISMSVEKVLETCQTPPKDVASSDLLTAAKHITEDTSLMASLLSLVTDSLSVSVRTVSENRGH